MIKEKREAEKAILIGSIMVGERGIFLNGEN